MVFGRLFRKKAADAPKYPADGPGLVGGYPPSYWTNDIPDLTPATPEGEAYLLEGTYALYKEMGATRDQVPGMSDAEWAKYEEWLKKQ